MVLNVLFSPDKSLRVQTENTQKELNVSLSKGTYMSALFTPASSHHEHIHNHIF